MTVQFNQFDGNFISRAEFKDGFGSEFMRIVVVETTRDQFYRHIVFLHSSKGHYANTCFERKQLKSIMTSSFRIDPYASAIFESCPNCFIKIVELYFREKVV